MNHVLLWSAHFVILLAHICRAHQLMYKKHLQKQTDDLLATAHPLRHLDVSTPLHATHPATCTLLAQL